uniref:Uncharacterized protein n=1 Tax=Pithovirus LCPAC102 TaxID=2506587 RepID=A0A4D5XG64_9VIRU|nr:MAG: hypothetical protein LCPAC102_01890 [Pithovirus LCPAC102]
MDILEYDNSKSNNIIGYRYKRIYTVDYNDDQTQEITEIYIPSISIGFNISYDINMVQSLNVFELQNPNNYIYGNKMSKYNLAVLNNIFDTDHDYLLKHIEYEYIKSTPDQETNMEKIKLTSDFVSMLVNITYAEILKIKILSSSYICDILSDNVMYTSETPVYGIDDPEFPNDLRIHLIKLKDIIDKDK